jgi:hypothetical protein
VPPEFDEADIEGKEHHHDASKAKDKEEVIPIYHLIIYHLIIYHLIIYHLPFNSWPPTFG